MTVARGLRYPAGGSVAGCGLFSAFVIAGFRAGPVYTARRDDGTSKDRVPPRGAFAMLTIPVALILLQLVANQGGLARQGLKLRFGVLYLANLLHYLILFLYDTLIIDRLVVGVWRPGCLQVPDAMGSESMKRRMVASLPVGLGAGAVLGVRPGTLGISS